MALKVRVLLLESILARGRGLPTDAVLKEFEAEVGSVKEGEEVLEEIADILEDDFELEVTEEHEV